MWLGSNILDIFPKNSLPEFWFTHIFKLCPKTSCGQRLCDEVLWLPSAAFPQPNAAPLCFKTLILFWFFLFHIYYHIFIDPRKTSNKIQKYVLQRCGCQDEKQQNQPIYYKFSNLWIYSHLSKNTKRLTI